MAKQHDKQFKLDAAQTLPPPAGFVSFHRTITEFSIRHLKYPVNTTKTITSGIFPAIVTVHSREFDSYIYQKVR